MNEIFLTKVEVAQALRSYLTFLSKSGLEPGNSKTATYTFPPRCDLCYEIILKTVESISSIFRFMIIFASTSHRVSQRQFYGSMEPG